MAAKQTVKITVPEEEKEKNNKEKASEAKKSIKKNSKKKSSKKSNGSKKSADQVKLASAEEKVESLTEETGKLRDQMLRARAEFENYKRRRKNEIEQLSSLANEGLIEDILPVLDDFELLIQNAGKEENNTALLEGAKMIRQKLSGSLEKRGLKKIEAKGQIFDPEMHEALLEMPSADVEPGTIIDVQQDGYRLGGKLLRPTRVIIAKAVEEN